MKPYYYFLLIGLMGFAQGFSVEIQPTTSTPAPTPTTSPRFKRGLYAAVSPVSGVAIGTTSNDLALKVANVAIGVDILPNVAAQFEIDGDYFLNLAQVGNYHLFNYSLFVLLSPIDGRIKPYIFGGPGAFNFVQESTYTSKLITDLTLSGGAGGSINIDRHQSIDLKSGLRVYRNFQYPNGVWDDAWSAITVHLMYKYTF